MRIINNKKRKYIFLLCGIYLTFCVCGCGAKYDMPYTVNSYSSSFRIVDREETASSAVPFATDLCVVSDNLTTEDVDMSKATGAALFDINTKETLYAKNVHDKLYPASLTKVMTALVALKYGSSDMMLTASSNVTNLESGAQTCGLKAGDQMTLAQALHVLLINSANDEIGRAHV